ncbi:MAG TPA: cell division topological specificity factor MinE [Anaerolineales bacterium]
MSRFFDRLLGRDQKSARQAKERMKLVLIHDRTDLTQSTMEALKDELIAVISRHVEIEPEAVRIEMAQDGREQRLIADIPLRTVRRRRVG